MKTLLLTSGGIQVPAIKDEVLKILTKPATKTITPIAMNIPVINFEVITFDKDAPYVEPVPQPLDEITWKDKAKDNLLAIGIVGFIILVILIFFIIVITDSKD